MPILTKGNLLSSDAIVNPRTVMIKYCDTGPTVVTMLRASWFKYNTFRADFVCFVFH